MTDTSCIPRAIHPVNWTTFILVFNLSTLSLTLRARRGGEPSSRINVARSANYTLPYLHSLVAMISPGDIESLSWTEFLSPALCLGPPQQQLIQIQKYNRALSLQLPTQLYRPSLCDSLRNGFADENSRLVTQACHPSGSL